MEWLDQLQKSLIDDIAFFRDLNNDFPNEDFKEDLIENLEKEALSLFNLINSFKEGYGRVRVGVIGNFSSGKSTFINSLIGKSICPMHVNPTTSSVTIFTYGDTPEIILTDEKQKTKKKITQDEYVNLSQHASEGSGGKFFKFLYRYPSDILRNIELIDTPGFENPNNDLDAKITEEVLKNESDVVLYVQDINQPQITDKARVLIESVKAKKPEVKWYLILNKADLKSPDSVMDIVDRLKKDEFIAEVFEDIYPYSSEQVRVYLENTIEEENEIKNAVLENVRSAIKEIGPEINSVSFDVSIECDKVSRRRGCAGNIVVKIGDIVKTSNIKKIVSEEIKPEPEQEQEKKQESTQEQETSWFKSLKKKVVELLPIFSNRENGMDKETKHPKYEYSKNEPKVEQEKEIVKEIISTNIKNGPSEFIDVRKTFIELLYRISSNKDSFLQTKIGNKRNIYELKKKKVIEKIENAISEKIQYMQERIALFNDVNTKYNKIKNEVNIITKKFIDSELAYMDIYGYIDARKVKGSGIFVDDGEVVIWSYDLIGFLESKVKRYAFELSEKIRMLMAGLPEKNMSDFFGIINRFSGLACSYIRSAVNDLSEEYGDIRFHSVDEAEKVLFCIDNYLTTLVISSIHIISESLFQILGNILDNIINVESSDNEKELVMYKVILNKIKSFKSNFKKFGK